MPCAFIGCHPHALIAQRIDKPAIAEIEFPRTIKFADNHIDHRIYPVAMPGNGNRADKAGCHRFLAHRIAITRESGDYQIFVTIGDSGINPPSGAKIEQHQLAGFRLIAIIGKIRVRLDDAKFKYFSHDQFEQQTHRGVPRSLRSVNK